MLKFEEKNKWIEICKKDYLATSNLKILNNNKIDPEFFEPISIKNGSACAENKLGHNAINSATIKGMVFSWAKYLIANKTSIKNKGIIISTDLNNANTEMYMEMIAALLKSLNIKTYIFINETNTPLSLVSFAVKKMKTAGAIHLSCLKNNEKHFGINFLNESGFLIQEKESNKVNKMISKLNILNQPNYVDFKLIKINENIFKDYMDSVLKLIQNKDVLCKLKVLVSGGKKSIIDIYSEILNKYGIDYSRLKNEKPVDLSKFTKNVNKQIKKTNSDIAIQFGKDNSKIGVVVKHEGKLTALKSEEISTILTYYKLFKMNLENRIKNNSTIYKTIDNTNILNRIAKRYNVQHISATKSFNSALNTFVDKHYESIALVSANYNFILDTSIVTTPDPFQAFIKIIEIANYLKTQNKTLIDYLDKIKKSFGHGIKDKHQIKSNQYFINVFIRTKKIGKIKVDRVKTLDDQGIYKLTLENDSWILVDLISDYNYLVQSESIDYNEEKAIDFSKKIKKHILLCIAKAKEVQVKRKIKEKAKKNKR